MAMVLLTLDEALLLGLLLNLVGGSDVLRDTGLHLLEHAHGGLVDVETILDLLVNPGHFGDEVHTALALLLLKLQGDAADGATGEALHDVGGVAGDLVLELLGGGQGNIEDDALVGVEVSAELAVVLLDDLARGALHGLRADLTHAVPSVAKEKAKRVHD